MTSLEKSLEKPDLVTTNVRYRMPNVHPEGRKFVVIAAAIVAALFFWVLDWELARLDLGRGHPVGRRLLPRSDPDHAQGRRPDHRPGRRHGDDDRDRAAAARAGRARTASTPGPCMRVSIFMWVFDVHINRAPIAGEIKRVVYIAGKFLNADLDKASEENERQHFLVEGARRHRGRLHPDRRAGRPPDRAVGEGGRPWSPPASGSA